MCVLGFFGLRALARKREAVVDESSKSEEADKSTGS